MENVNNVIYQAKFALKTNWLLAVKILEDALVKFPENEDIYVELAEIYTSKEVYKKALEYYQITLNINPKNDFARFKTGNIYLELGEPKMAIIHYDKMTEDYPEALFNKAIAYKSLHKLDDAVVTLKKLTEHSVQMIGAYKYLVEILVTLGKLKEAVNYIDKARKSFGDVFLLHYLRGLVYEREKNLIGAYHEYMIAAREDSEYPHVHKTLAKLADAIGQKNQVLKHLRKAIRQRFDVWSSIKEFVEHVVKYDLVNDLDGLRELMSDFDDLVFSHAKKIYLELRGQNGTNN